MTILIIGSFLVLAGLFTIAKSIYDKFFRPCYPNPKKWIRVKAKVIGNSQYESTEYVSPANLAFRSPRTIKTESVIEYSVEGKTYRKTITSMEKGRITIFCLKKNPHRFKTADELKGRHYTNKNTAAFLGTTGFAVLFIIIGTAFIFLGLKELNPPDISLKFYPPQ